MGVFDTRETLVEPLETVGEALMIDAQAVQYGGVEVTGDYRILDDIVGEVVGLAVGDSALDSPPANHILKQRPWRSRPLPSAPWL